MYRTLPRQSCCREIEMSFHFFCGGFSNGGGDDDDDDDDNDDGTIILDYPLEVSAPSASSVS